MHALATLRVSLLSVGLSVVLASAQTQPALSVTPNPVLAGQSFWLYLHGLATADCYTTFAHESVTVVGTRINLRYTTQKIFYPATPPAAPGCPMPVTMAETTVIPTPVILPNLPTFLMPALAAGKYEVWASDVPACLVPPASCELAEPAPVSAGNLQVTAASARKDWYLKQRTVPPDAGFQLQMLRDSLAACTTFSNLNAVVSSGSINLYFLRQTGKCALISQDPIGPEFTMPALKAGRYPVYVTELLPCEVTQPVCAVDRVMPVASDTLFVGNSSAVRMSVLRAGALRVDVVGNTAFFSLPEGKAGIWRAELMTLDGRVLAGKSLAGGSGERVSMPVDRARANAVSLLRLTSPEGRQRFMPIVR